MGVTGVVGPVYTGKFPCGMQATAAWSVAVDGGNRQRENRAKTGHRKGESLDVDCLSIRSRLIIFATTAAIAQAVPYSDRAYTAPNIDCTEETGLRHALYRVLAAQTPAAEGSR